MNTMVLIHGCHLQADGWKDIVWGAPDLDVFGRASAGIRLAVREGAFIYWGTGASAKDGMKESRYTFEFAVNHVNELRGLTDYMTHEVAKDWLERISFIDEVTQNTTEEIARAVEVCLKYNIDRLILLSSPTHIARCLQEAEKLRACGKMSTIEVFATASDVCFAHSSAGDVVIVEPPHRGDLPS